MKLHILGVWSHPTLHMQNSPPGSRLPPQPGCWPSGVLNNLQWDYRRVRWMLPLFMEQGWEWASEHTAVPRDSEWWGFCHPPHVLSSVGPENPFWIKNSYGLRLIKQQKRMLGQDRRLSGICDLVTRIRHWVLISVRSASKVGWKFPSAIRLDWRFPGKPLNSWASDFIINPFDSTLNVFLIGLCRFFVLVMRYTMEREWLLVGLPGGIFCPVRS